LTPDEGAVVPQHALHPAATQKELGQASVYTNVLNMLDLDTRLAERYGQCFPASGLSKDDDLVLYDRVYNAFGIHAYHRDTRCA
jgi:hypothetical protein